MAFAATVTHNPMYGTGGTGTITTKMIRVQKLLWVDMADTNQLVLNNNAGNEIIDYTATVVANIDYKFELTWPKGFTMDGAVIATFGGGKLYLYLME